MLATCPMKYTRRRWPKARKEIATRLKTLRDKREWSNAELAEFLGVTLRALQGYLYDVTIPIPGCVEKLLDHAEAGKI